VLSASLDQLSGHVIPIVVAGFVKRETSAKEIVPDLDPRCAAMLPGAWSVCKKTK
jgi:hypothetical protein